MKALRILLGLLGVVLIVFGSVYVYFKDAMWI
jgi:hypothetical protein